MIRVGVLLGLELGPLSLERDRDVAQEQQAERTCLYSPASMEPRILSAAWNSCFSIFISAPRLSLSAAGRPKPCSTAWPMMHQLDRAVVGKLGIFSRL